MSLSVDEILGPGGLLARAIPDYEVRPQQLEMADAVAGALRANRPLLVEAGTGTGKTLAYLVPALLSERRVVVSTGTKNLQEQILKKDIPLLQRHLPFEFTAAGLKGISNYLCLRRFREHAGRTRARLGDGLHRIGAGSAHVGSDRASREELAALDRLGDWAERTTSGDRAELPELPDDSPLWREVSSTTETRIGPRCPHFEDCFVTRARRAAQRADLLVVNHHLFFADLALRAQWPEAQLLPAYEAVIFDEAHQLEDVATEYFGRSVSSLRTGGLIRDLRKAIDAHHMDARAERTADHLETCAEAMWDALRSRLRAPGRSDARTVATDELWRGDPTRGFLDLDTALEELEGAAGSARPGTPEGDEACAALSRRARALRDDLALIADRSDRRHVYWLETRGRTVLLHASPVDVAESIRERLFSSVEAAIFTSATLAAGGSFDYVRARLGLETAGDLRLDSPFDYARQALLYLPRDLPEPSDPTFLAAAAERMAALVEVSGGRAFLLFTSHRNMAQAFRLLHRSIRFPVHLQGERPKHLLLEEFRARPSVLFATASFWEGVDVVGDALRLVVIDKLPFAPPDDPLVAARCRKLEEEGMDAFSAYQLPEAALALAQGFGRLIRHREDRGVVALLDRRAVTRGYGRRVLSSLPADCPRTQDLDEVRAFYARLPAR